MNNTFQTEVVLRRYGSTHNVTVVLDEKSLKSAWAKYCQWKKSLQYVPYMATRKIAIMRLRSEGLSLREIAARWDISTRTVYRILQAAVLQRSGN